MSPLMIAIAFTVLGIAGEVLLAERLDRRKGLLYMLAVATGMAVFWRLALNLGDNILTFVALLVPFFALVYLIRHFIVKGR